MNFFLEKPVQKIKINCDIKTWKQFGRKVRSQDRDLLINLDKFPDSVLVTGCQRSGTTILARIVSDSEGMVNYWFGKDDELDAALILSGCVDYKKKGRYCFQTTYLNERYHEYFKHDEYKIIWVIRNPYSVVYSLVYNWRRFALNELFFGCGYQFLNDKKKQRYKNLGAWSIDKFTKACLSYNGKLSQAFELSEKLGKEKILFVDYDQLIERKDIILPKIYKFVEIKYNQEYGKKLHGKSLKKAKNLSKRRFNMIETICMPMYNRVTELINM